MEPFCKVLGTLLLSVLLPWPSAGQFHVIGPKGSTIALVGKEAVLSCHLNPMMNAQDFGVNWYRKHPSGLVHRYGTSQENMKQMPAYEGRTEFLKENITQGQVALKIHSIHPSDDGMYSCFFESSIHKEEAQFEVVVTGSGVPPRIHIEPGNTKEIKLTCISTGWFPEPEVHWRNLKGQLLMPDSETKTAEENGLFHVETSVTLDKSSGEGVSCHIRNPVLSEEKEVHISVADALFSRNHASIVALAVFMSFLIVATIIGAIWIWHLRRK